MIVTKTQNFFFKSFYLKINSNFDLILSTEFVERSAVFYSQLFLFKNNLIQKSIKSTKQNFLIFS